VNLKPAAPKWRGGFFQFFSSQKAFKKDGNSENPKVFLLFDPKSHCFPGVFLQSRNLFCENFHISGLSICFCQYCYLHTNFARKIYAV
jgi:hypothetical protein